MSTAQKVRIGFVGVGGMGQNAHLKHYAFLPDCEVVAIAELRPKLAAKVAQRYSIPKVYANHQEMLAAEKLDGVVCIQPFTLHGQLLPEVYAANLPMITEKPLASSVQVGEELLAKLAKTKATHYVGYHKRSDPASMEALGIIKQFRASGEMGKLNAVRVSMPPGDWVANGFWDLIHSDERAEGIKWDGIPEGVSKDWHDRYVGLVNYYIHQINLARYLAGGPYKVAYVDKTQQLMVGHTEDGVLVTLEMGWFGTQTEWYEVGFAAFANGWVKIELPAPVAINRPGRLTVYRNPKGQPLGTTTIYELPWRSAMQQQAMNFVKAIRGEATPLETAADAQKDLIVARDMLLTVDAVRAGKTII